jgi:hypothetical protein
MLSIYDSGYKRVEDMTIDYDLTPIRNGFYYPPEFIPLLPMVFEPEYEYKTFLIDVGRPDDRVQHFVVVIRRLIQQGGNRYADSIHAPEHEYYSMGFGKGPSNLFVLASPDYYIKNIADLQKYRPQALKEYTPLGDLAQDLNDVVSNYTEGGYSIRGSRIFGYFAVHETRIKYNPLRHTCITGFDKVFPIPTKCFHRLERLSYFISTGKNKKNVTRRIYKRK